VHNLDLGPQCALRNNTCNLHPWQFHSETSQFLSSFIPIHCNHFISKLQSHWVNYEINYISHDKPNYRFYTWQTLNCGNELSAAQSTTPSDHQVSGNPRSRLTCPPWLTRPRTSYIPALAIRPRPFFPCPALHLPPQLPKPTPGKPPPCSKSLPAGKSPHPRERSILGEHNSSPTLTSPHQGENLHPRELPPRGNHIVYLRK